MKYKKAFLFNTIAFMLIAACITAGCRHSTDRSKSPEEEIKEAYAAMETAVKKAQDKLDAAVAKAAGVTDDDVDAAITAVTAIKTTVKEYENAALKLVEKKGDDAVDEFTNAIDSFTELPKGVADLLE